MAPASFKPRSNSQIYSQQWTLTNKTNYRRSGRPFLTVRKIYTRHNQTETLPIIHTTVPALSTVYLASLQPLFRPPGRDQMGDRRCGGNGTSGCKCKFDAGFSRICYDSFDSETRVRTFLKRRRH